MTLSRKLLPFLLLSIIHLASMFLAEEMLDMVTKPLLMPALMYYFVGSAVKSPLNNFVIVALIFSFLGDTLLMFAEANDLFFLIGLVSFLIAHITYIIINLNAKEIVERGIKPQWQDIPFVVYGLFIFTWLKDGLGEMYIPTLIYTVIICLMVITARKRWKKADNKSFWLVMMGASFFVVSDSLLAINKFDGAFQLSDPAIMTTYLLAQFLMIEGYKSFINSIVLKA
ncbi:MAG TPA: lysoplasmalogenase [Roseivirga sp.]